MNLKKTAQMIIWLACLTLAAAADGAPIQPRQAKLIRVVVDGPEELAAMFESFFTEKGFALVDDDEVPIFDVTAERRVVGPPRDCKVSYQVIRADLRLPGKGTVYVSSPKTAHDYGTEAQASASALHLLKTYFAQDTALDARLAEVSPATYYDLALTEDPRDRQIDEIMKQVTQISLTLASMGRALRPAAPVPDDRARLTLLASEQREIRREIGELAEKMQAGQAAASEEAFRRVAAKIDAAVSQPPPAAADCGEDEGRDYGSVGAVLIRVPTAGSQRLVTGDYRVCEENGRCLYQRSAEQVGIRVAGSMPRLLGSSAGEYFRSRDRYLDFIARGYEPADGTILVSRCDAAALRRLSRVNNDLFAKGRIFIVPLVTDRSQTSENPSINIKEKESEP